MAILQACRADVLKEIRGDWSDSGGCKGAAQSHSAHRAVGRLMAGSAAERHLLLNLRGEPLHRYGARSDRKSVSARFKHALLTQNRHSHP